MNRMAVQVAWCLAVCVVAGGGTVLGQEPVTNLRDLAASLDLTERGVARWLERLGARTEQATAERLLAVDLKGRPLAELQGGRGSVVVSVELDGRLRQSGRAVVLIHNHPSSVGLSAADLTQTGKPGVAAIVALGHDGSVFLAAAGPRLDPDRFEYRQYALARDEVSKRLRLDWRCARPPAPAIGVHFSHLVTLALAEADIVQYSFVLRGEARDSYAESRLAFSQVVVGAAAQLKRRK